MKVLENKNLSELTTIGVGGPALYYIEVQSIEEMRQAFLFASQHSLPFLLIGRGSNMLCHDLGFQGVAIHNKIAFLERKEMDKKLHLHVGGGYNFSLLGTQTARWGFSGLEFASGIPASVGGAIFMNAGANGKESCDHLESVEWLDAQGKLHVFDRKDLSFSYRHSPFQNMQGAIVGASFLLNPSASSRLQQIEIINKRKATQPLQEMSAGCIFRNPRDAFSGALIEKCSLKGLKLGDAKVSEVHANFIINQGKATAEEIEMLIEKIQKEVLEKTGYMLASEVRRIPYRPDQHDI